MCLTVGRFPAQRVALCENQNLCRVRHKLFWLTSKHWKSQYYLCRVRHKLLRTKFSVLNVSSDSAHPFLIIFFESFFQQFKRSNWRFSGLNFWVFTSSTDFIVITFDFELLQTFFCYSNMRKVMKNRPFLPGVKY